MRLRGALNDENRRLLVMIMGIAGRLSGHRLVVFYHLLKGEGLQYHELGDNYFDILDPIRLRHHLVKRLELLGYEVTLTERQAA